MTTFAMLASPAGPVVIEEHATLHLAARSFIERMRFGWSDQGEGDNAYVAGWGEGFDQQTSLVVLDTVTGQAWTIADLQRAILAVEGTIVLVMPEHLDSLRYAQSHTPDLRSAGWQIVPLPWLDCVVDAGLLGTTDVERILTDTDPSGRGWGGLT
jgi:hypothetical protein